MPSENGWEPARCGPELLEWVVVPGTNPPVKLQLQKGQPSALLKAFSADYNEFVERLRDGDSAGWTPTNAVATSNHLNGTAIDLDWDTPHTFHVSYSGFSQQQITTCREILDFYEGTIQWGQDWNGNPFDCMHWQCGYNTYGNPHTADFIARKIRADGFSTFRRGGESKPQVPTAVLASAVTATNGTEKVLKYPSDQQHVAQETGYWCGPASTQNVLACRGITVSERDLANQMGTTENGTDYIGQIEKVLDRYCPEAQYTTVDLHDDPPTPAQREKFWADLVSSIDAGYGIVMNWVSPASNPPIGIKGSQSPSGYGRHTVMHYLAACGYDSSARAVWVVDSGFQPFQYWISLDNCMSLMPPKGYCFAAGAPRTVQPAAFPKADHGVDVLSEVMGGALPKDRYAALLPSFEAALIQCDCTTVDRIAMLCAQVGEETAGLKWLEELADGSEYEGRSDLGNTENGDGSRFKGRGAIMVTGRRNYTVLSEWAFAQKLTSSPTFFVDQPSQLSTDRYVFVGMTWFWTTQRKLNDAADAKNIEQATRMINGGLTGIADRRDRYQKALAMGDRLLDLHQQAPTEVPAMPGNYKSVSPYRNPTEGAIGGIEVFAISDDGMIHALFVEEGAQLGDHDSIYRVVRSAAGKGADTSEAFVHRARAVLAKVPRADLSAVLNDISAKEPELLQALMGRPA